MKDNYYLTKNGRLERSENTVYYIVEEIGKVPIPVERIYAIYAYGRVSFTSGVVSHLAKHGVPIHFFNYYGFYEGSFYPREKLVSGHALVKQAEHYLDPAKRQTLAAKFVKGAALNIGKNLSYYERNGKDVSGEAAEIEALIPEIDTVRGIPELMQIEGRIRENYYRAWDEILPGDFRFEKRTRRPPENAVNALISFGNSLIYTAMLSEIYNTQLNPTISYLHEPSERRFSLSLDITEIFKPIIVDRVIFRVVNKRIIGLDDFQKDMNYWLLTDAGKKKFLRAWEEKLNETIMHRRLKRKVSFRTLMRLECYKVVKHIIGGEEYRPFIMWW